MSGLTSAGNRQFVEGLAVYDSVVAYDEIDSLPGNRAVYVDISGDGGIRAAVHNRYGDRLAHSAAVGATHHDQLGAAAELTGQPVFFFALTASASAAPTGAPRSWTRTSPRRGGPSPSGPRGGCASRISSEDEIQGVYLELLDGKVDPEAGTVVELDGSA